MADSSYIEGNLTVEAPSPWLNIKGQVHLYEGPSTEGFPEVAPPAQIIQTDQSATLVFRWNDGGHFLPLIYCAKGEYECSVVFEKFGPEETEAPGLIPPAYTPVKLGTSPSPSPPFKYNQKLTIQPNTIPVGLYRIVCCLTLKANCPKPTNLPVAGFTDLGIIKVIDA